MLLKVTFTTKGTLNPGRAHFKGVSPGNQVIELLKVDQKGPRIVKEHRGSPRKIDAAVSAVMAHDRATMVRELVPEVAPAIWVV